MSNDIKIGLSSVLNAQQQAHLSDPYPAAATRIDRLDRLIAMVIENSDQLCDAVNQDFAGRSSDNTYASDLMGIIGAAKHAKKLIPSFMKTEKRKIQFPLNLLGARCEVVYTPLGVVGNVSPWNFPVGLALQPLGEIFAAGNRCMLKPSELTPATSNIMAELSAKYFDQNELAVIQGGPEVAEEFTKLPFDHLLFTGSTNIAKLVMASAAPNLTPLTLELGGKSPVIITESANLTETATKVMFGKTLNAGQICLAPDYVFIPENLLDSFIEEAKKATAEMFPSYTDNPDFTSIITQRHYDRLCDLVQEAEGLGAEAIYLADKNIKGNTSKRFEPVLIKNPPLQSKVMQEELFGPVLPILTYTDLDQVIKEINSKPHPLAIYFFGSDKEQLNKVTQSTRCGGMTINDVIFHVAQDDLPFGGVGDSGMGYYHGIEGLKNFSHAKAIYKQSGMDIAKLFRPPYTDKYRKFIKKQLKT